ncbi:methyltransferase [Actinomadura sp. CNU-125]|uniref:methyltransferase n=1 Tax=Actinomadura sp. CNU-125 TaxID=1904961 RepID=UPI0009625440|nr:methyltransferase [Actinomadura sp. CNU-125]OLT19130.1 methyltransferase [Actinomadura sp. CNU-125]
MTVPSQVASGPANDVQALRRLNEMADYIVPFTLRAVCDLRIADHLADGPRTIDELAELTGTHAPSLYRAMRVLATKDVFTETGPGVFGMTPLAEPLRGDHPQSLRDAYPLLAPDVRAWALLAHSLRTGEPAFDEANGKGAWEYFAEHPEESARFDASQRAVTRREIRALIPAYDWASLGSVVDVGGGNGAFAAAILAAHPGLAGTVFDQPHVVAGADPVLTEHGVAGRCAVVGGDYRRSVPEGAGGYVLKRVMYSMDDEQAVAVLRLVRAAMRPDGRVLVIEPVVVPGNDFDWGKLYDLLLLTMSGGGGRTREQIERVLGAADLELVRVISTKSLPIIEARPIQ